jgi:hypothetical protein
MTAILALIANAILAVHGYLRKDLGILLLGLWFTLYNAVLTYYKVGRDQKDSDDA